MQRSGRCCAVRLQVLDVSVNAVPADDIRALAELPCLKELDISRYCNMTLLHLVPHLVPPTSSAG